MTVSKTSQAVALTRAGFAAPGLAIFELDHPDTQADKRARLDAIVAEDLLVTACPAS